MPGARRQPRRRESLRDGGSPGSGSRYGAELGSLEWIARYDGPSGPSDEAYSIAVRPDESELFVTGTSSGVRTEGDFATVAHITG